MIDRDILISRVIDGEATAEDWSALHALAREDADIWSELASAQQDHAELTSAVRLLTACADDSEAPILEHAQAGFSARVRAVASWGGWVAAAVLALSFGLGSLSDAPPTDANKAGFPIDLSKAKEQVLPQLSAEEALGTYVINGVREGRVVAMDPDLHVMTAVPLEAAGQFEVVYVRRILEKARVDLYRISQTEGGQFIRLPVEEMPKPKRAF